MTLRIGSDAQITDNNVNELKWLPRQPFFIIRRPKEFVCDHIIGCWYMFKHGNTHKVIATSLYIVTIRMYLSYTIITLT